MCPDDHKPGAKVRVVAQAPGEAEERGRRFVRWFNNAEGAGEIWEPDTPRPMIGKTGWELDNKFLPLAGLKREDVEVCNVVRCRLDGSNDLPPLTTTMARDMVTHCQRAYWKEPSEGQTLVALGAYSLWALTGEYEGDDDDADSAEDDLRASKSIDGWRGWLVPYRPVHQVSTVGREQLNPRVYATYHPSYYYRVHWLKAIGRMDFARLGRYLRGAWPEPFPTISQEIPTDCGDPVALDTEYNPHTREMHRYSLGWRLPDETPRVHVVEARDMYRYVKPVPQRVLFQNAEADWPYTRSILGCEPTQWDDDMPAHAVLYGTLRHSLDFMGSLYARHNRWKHLQQSDPLVYAGMDALGTWDIWQQLARELARDPASADLYEHELKPLLPHLLRRPSVPLNAMYVAQASAELKQEQQEIEARGRAVAGWPISISSPDQISRWLKLKT